MTQDEIIASNLSEVEKANERIKMLEDKLASIKQAVAELESQEPVATLENLEQEIYENTRNFVSRDVMEWMLRRYYTHPPQRTEQNFCSRCGKRTADLTTIHTCTPPVAQPPQRTWVGLTEEEIIDVIHPLVMADMPDQATDYEIAKAIEAKLKEKNT